MRHFIAIFTAALALSFGSSAFAGGHGGFGRGFGTGGCVAPSASFGAFGGGYGSGFGAAAAPCGGGFNAGLGMGYGGFSAAMPTVVAQSYAMPIVQQQVVAPVAAMSYGVAPAFGVGVGTYGVSSSFGVGGFGVAPYAVSGPGFGVTGAVVATPRVGFFARRRAGRQAARQVRRSLRGF
jgi:hypothetical protein